MGSRSSSVLRRLVAVALAGLAGLSVVARGQVPLPDAAERQRLEALEQRADERLTSLQREADQLAKQQRGLLDQLRALEVKRDMAGADLAKTEAALGLAQADRARIASQLDDAERQVAELRPRVHRRVAALYAAGSTGTLRAWLSSDDLAASARDTRLLAEVTAQDRREFERFAALKAELGTRRVELDRRTKDAETLRAKALDARDRAARATQDHAALVRQVDAQRDLTARLAGELETARTQLQQHLAGLAQDPSAPAVLPIAPFKGTLPWPATGRVAAAFGRQASSRFGTTVPRSGIEIAVPRGTQVRATHNGRVAYADTFSGFGRLVIVDHGQKAFSLYGYLDEINVKRGEDLDRGHLIGSSGESPEGKPALYFELRIDARPVNPIEWLKR
jgi:murein hydrolase activator